MDVGTAVAQWLRCCATNRKVDGSIPDGVIEFFIDKILPIVQWHWGRLSLKQKWVPGQFPGGICGRCVKLTNLPPPCAVVIKAGNLNFLEISGPLQACNGTALPFTRWTWVISFTPRLFYTFRMLPLSHLIIRRVGPGFSGNFGGDK